MMFVILCYDVETRRVGRVMKTVKKYLQPVQESVFEGDLTATALHRLQNELACIVQPESDSVILYCASSASQLEKMQLGVSEKGDDLFL